MDERNDAGDEQVDAALLDAGASLRIAITKLSRQLNPSASDEHLTPTEASVLGILAARGPSGLSQLASIEALNRTMVSRAVSRLDEDGLVRRIPNPDDLRSASVAITPDGLQTNERIRASRAHTVVTGLSRLPKEARTAILGALPWLDALAEDLINNRPSR